MSEQTPTVAQAVRGAVESSIASMRKVMPGRVVKYNTTTQRASVQPLLPDGYTNERGERVVEDLPVVNEVPIVFQGSGGARVRFPIHVGDTVLLLFADGSLDRWLHKGDGGDPKDDRRHHLTDAIAIPGLLHAPSDADVMIEFTETQIHAGGTEALALLSELQALITSYNAHVHSGVTAGPGSSGPPGAPAVIPTGTTVLKGS